MPDISFPVYSKIKPSLGQRFYQAFKRLLRPFGVNEKIGSYFRLEKFSRLLHPMHFNQDSVDDVKKKAFFKSQLVEVEIETHGYCNRTCHFCPNHVGNRLDKNEMMALSTFERIMDELASMDFSGSIKMHRYNEPLSNDIIYDRVAYARRKLPKANIGFHSNGDFLTAEKLKKLDEIGLNYLMVSLYVNYDKEEKLQKIQARDVGHKFLKKIGLLFEEHNSANELYQWKIPMPRLDVTVFVPNFLINGNDRGGVVKEYTADQRLSPCISPFGRLFIDWTGDVLPCCNLRGDLVEHKSSILGNVSRQSLMDVYYSKISNQFRYWLADVSPKEGVCKTCKYDCFTSGPLSKKLMQKAMKKALNQI